MTLKEWKAKLHSHQQSEQQNKAMDNLIQRLRGKPFWYFYKEKHREATSSTNSNCCFNHIIGLPKKGNSNRECPIFDYEVQILRALEEPAYINSRPPTQKELQLFNQKLVDMELNLKNKHGTVREAQQKIRDEKTNTLIHPERVGHVLVLKSAGLGLTTFFLRYLAWLCLEDDKLKGQDIIIITGPREALSIDLITRLRQLFLPFNITFDTRETTMFLNGVRIRSMPSNNLSAARGIESLAVVFLDEAAFFDKASQAEVLDVVERYAGKSRAKIILTSTPNRPGDLMHTILNSSKKDFYKVLKFDYTWGINKIYDPEDIRIAKASDSFEREYNLSFSSPEGNVFTHASINRAIELGRKYPDTINKAAKHSLGCDPGFGSSQFGLCVLEYSDSVIKVVHAEQYERSSFSSMVQEVWNIKNMVGSLNNIYIDQANPEFIEAIKQEIGENSNWQYIHEKMTDYKKRRLNISNAMVCVPVSFSQEGASMLAHCKNLLENDDSIVAINPKHEKLLTGLRGSIAQEYKLNKTETPYSDLIDAFRLAAKYFQLKK